MHWRQAAEKIGCRDPEILASDDEKYALYNFLFEALEEFRECFKLGNIARLKEIQNFVQLCLDNVYESSGEELDLAAGVGFAEHLFDNVDENSWISLHSTIGHDFYLKCERWIRNWVDETRFAEIQGKIHATRT